MDHISEIFDRMDAWRHLPNYQLERRADLFFSLYLPEVIAGKLGFSVHQQLIPEFPVRIGTIYPHIPIDKSYKVDYVAVSTDLSKTVLIELKTDGSSRRPEQDAYLTASRDVGLAALIGGVLQIFRASNSKRKYFCFLEYLESMGILKIPASLTKIMAARTLQGAAEASLGIEVTVPPNECQVLYVQPNGTASDVVNFEEVAAIVGSYDDAVSKRFSASLDRWSRSQAGDARGANPAT